MKFQAFSLLSFFVLSFLCVTCSTSEILFPEDVSDLTDNNRQTSFSGTTGKNRLLFHNNTKSPVKSYSIFSSGESPEHDPYSWTLKGSAEGKEWVIVDKQEDQMFCSRFQEKMYAIQNPENYEQYLLEIKTKDNDTLKIAEVTFFHEDKLKDWKNFSHPEVDFRIVDDQTKGSEIYKTLVQSPEEYIRYHARKVAEILYYSDEDTINNVEEVQYLLKDYDGISAKSGNSPVVSIVFSTRHVENSARKSLFKLNNETRGVLFHELTHAYQFEPKGIGTYSTNKEFWACIEGLADAVRTEAGFFDVNAQRKPGGNWLDGYRTTGFFLHWLTTKDPDAIRKFHLTVRDLPVWSFDKAMKHIFGPDSGIESLWNEYQEFLLTNKSNQ